MEINRVEYPYDADDHLIGRKMFSGGSSTPNVQRVFAYSTARSPCNSIGRQREHHDVDVTHRYLGGPAVDQLLADEDVNSVTSRGTVLWPLTDHLGTVRDWLDSATNVDHVEYDSFGKRMDTTAIDAAFSWTGRYRDSLTGLQYNNARWYDPAVGGWLSEDIIWDGANKYSYVGNMPTAYVDPSGLETTAPTAGGQQNSKSKPSRQYDLMREFGTNQRGSAFAKDVRPILETTGEVIAETNPISGTLLSECRIIFGYDPLRDQEVNDAQRGREKALMIIGTTAIGAIISRMLGRRDSIGKKTQPQRLLVCEVFPWQNN